MRGGGAARAAGGGAPAPGSPRRRAWLWGSPSIIRRSPGSGRLWREEDLRLRAALAEEIRLRAAVAGGGAPAPGGGSRSPLLSLFSPAKTGGRRGHAQGDASARRRAPHLASIPLTSDPRQSNGGRASRHPYRREQGPTVATNPYRREQGPTVATSMVLLFPRARRHSRSSPSSPRRKPATARGLAAAGAVGHSAIRHRAGAGRRYAAAGFRRGTIAALSTAGRRRRRAPSLEATVGAAQHVTGNRGTRAATQCRRGTGP
ncbi:unnamed protein product [Urochloa humidicola]